jgi:hypothetical protein
MRATPVVRAVVPGGWPPNTPDGGELPVSVAIATAVASSVPILRGLGADPPHPGPNADAMADRDGMHHHRLVLNGPAVAVARLADDLRAAGAVAIGPDGAAPARLVWATSRPSAVEALCARHRRVVVGMERFEMLGAELERLVLHGRDATLLERRTLATGPEAPWAQDVDDDPDEPDVGAATLLARTDRATDALARWGLCLEEDGEALDVAALRAAAGRVAALPVALGAAFVGSSLDDALLVGPALGRLCVAAGDPLAADRPPGVALEAVATLAAVALTVAAGCSGPACAGELDFERAWRLTQATAHASRETLWARPGDADWPEWLMALLAEAASVIESAAACLHRPPAPFASLHTEHYGTVDEQLDHAACALVSTGLQVLVLFPASTGN